jgi:hypothetical protein
MEKDWSRIVRGKFEDEYKKREIYVIVSSFMNFTTYEVLPPEDFEEVYHSPPAIAYGEEFKIYKFTGK